MSRSFTFAWLNKGDYFEEWALSVLRFPPARPTRSLPLPSSRQTWPDTACSSTSMWSR